MRDGALGGAHAPAATHWAAHLLLGAPGCSASDSWRWPQWCGSRCGTGGRCCPCQRHRRRRRPAAAAERHLALPALQAPRAAADVAPPQQGDDVYAYEPQPLEEGVRKHMLSVFVAGAPGCLGAWQRLVEGCRQLLR